MESAEGLADYQSLARVPDGGTALSPDEFILQSPTPGLSNILACDVEPELDLGNWGYFPDPSLGQQFESAQVGEPYFDVFHISVPTDASAIDPLFALPLDSMKIVSFQLIAEETGVSLAIDEIGLQVTCNNLNFLNSECTFLSGFQYCTAIEGSPTTPGIYSMSIILESG